MDIIISSVATYGLLAACTMFAVVGGLKAQKKPFSTKTVVIVGALWPLTIGFAIFGSDPPQK